MHISVYGAGYVGLVTATCLSKLGHHVICLDIDEEKIKRLARGDSPIFEQGLSELLREGLDAKTLKFTTIWQEAVNHASVHFIATGTPVIEENIDLSQVYDVAEQVGFLTQQDTLLVIKSTVPPGTAVKLECQLAEKMRALGKSYKIALVSNPEFLREGTAVSDFLKPERIIMGGKDAALTPLIDIYQPFIEKKIPVLIMDSCSAELSKYAVNTFLATKISLINYLSSMADKLGANIDNVRAALSTDPRLSPLFMQPGIGYGGACLPKDLQTLKQLAQSIQLDTNLLHAVSTINQTQKKWLFTKIFEYFKGKLNGLKIGLWGLAFKPGTDDMREASSLTLVKHLLAYDLQIYVYDPAAMSQAQTIFKQQQGINYCSSAHAVLAQQLDGLMIATEWPEFKEFPLLELQQKLAGAPIFDGRNCFNLAHVKQANLTYYSVGRPAVLSPAELFCST